MSTQVGLDNLKLLESGVLADVEIVCKERIWKVHKVILCARSKWFMRALTGNWKESIQGKVTVDEMDPNTMDTVLKYLYSGEMNIDKDENLRLEVYVQLWIHADFFQLDQLKDESLQCLRGSFMDTARRLWTYKFRTRRRNTLEACKDGWIQDKENLKLFNDNLFQALNISYTNPAAREIQKTLTACIYTMSLNVSNQQLSDSLEHLPKFEADMLTIFVGMRYDLRFEGGLEIDDICAVWKEGGGRCKLCDRYTVTKPQNIRAVIVNPFSLGKAGWCLDCGKDALDSRLQHVVSLM